jgi:hypothetical protein
MAAATGLASTSAGLAPGAGTSRFVASIGRSTFGRGRRSVMLGCHRPRPIAPSLSIVHECNIIAEQTGIRQSDRATLVYKARPSRRGAPGRNTGPLSQGVQAGRKALRICHIRGVEVRKKRPEGSSEPPEPPICCSPMVHRPGARPGAARCTRIAHRAVVVVVAVGAWVHPYSYSLMSSIFWEHKETNNDYQ